jgi:effector-binding domain-containing protein
MSWGGAEVVLTQKQEISVKNIGEEKVASKREKGTYGEVIPKLIRELMVELNSDENRGKVMISGPVMLIMHDRERKEKDADIEMAVPIAGDPVLRDPGIKVLKLPPMKVVSLIHKGPYQEVGQAYEAAFGYISEKGLKMAGPTRECYLNNPDEVKEDELLTEIQIPVE